MGTNPGRGISWGQMLISARKETYKWGIWENVKKERERMRFKRQTPIKGLQGERLGKEKRQKNEERK